MHPTGIGIGHETLVNAWRAFMENGREEEIEASGLDPAVVRS